jgi:hypothetical protein
MALGLSALVVCVVYVNRLDDHAYQITAHGVHTTGVVLADPLYTRTCAQVDVPIRFAVAGTEQTHEYFVDSCGTRIRKGDVVDVAYDRNTPGDFVVNGAANEKPVATLLAIMALVAGVFFVAGALIRGRRLGAMRRVLRANEWRDRPVHVARYSSPWSRNNRVAIRLLDAPQAPLLTQMTMRPALLLPSQEPLAVAGRGDGPCVVRARNGRDLFSARPPRSARARRWVLDALAGLEG